jgi:tetratricopeptide (TPR) repeat protein
MVGRKTAKLLCVGLMALSLSGCGRALELLGIRHEAKPEMQIRTADAFSATDAVAAGREHLAAGRTGQAIEEFQKALASGQEIGPAANGMGVAYARLGQFEQAHRFFAEALAVDPKNAKYQGNMARLMSSSLLAERHETDFAAQVAARTLTGAHDIQAAVPETAMADAVVPSDTAKATAQTVDAAGSTLVRVSRGEVMIRTMEPASARRSGPLPLVGVRGREIKGFKPAMRIEFSDKGKADAASSGEADKAGSETTTASADVKGFEPLVRINLQPARRTP